MKVKPGFTFIATSVISLMMLHGCTSNPIGDDDIFSGNRKLGGKIELNALNNNSNPEGVYLWLDGLNIGTKTDAQGEFEIILPPPGTQASGGISGIFNLYFYMANFKLDSISVAISDGRFVYSEGEINNRGELNRPKSLFQLLNINTIIMPDTVQIDSAGPISARFFIRALNKPVTVFFPKAVGDILGPIILKNKNTGEIFIRQSTIAGIPLDDTITITNVEIERIVLFGFSPGELPKGSYEVVPYLLVRQDHIPEGLIESIGEDVEELGPNYIKIPFLREGGQLEIE